MPVWDDLLNCVCQNAPQRPGVQEVIDTLNRHTVCTGTQCFETQADAFGLTAAGPSTVQPNTMFFMMMMFMMLVAVMIKVKKPTSAGASKPGSSSSHSNEPPPPATSS